MLIIEAQKKWINLLGAFTKKYINQLRCEDLLFRKLLD